MLPMNLRAALPRKGFLGRPSAVRRACTSTRCAPLSIEREASTRVELDLAVQRGSADLQQLGCLKPVATRLGEGILDLP
jgi:hypothetical protein